MKHKDYSTNGTTIRTKSNDKTEKTGLVKLKLEIIDFLTSFGWIAFSIDYNILNSTMQVIYPKILEEVSPSKSSYNMMYSLMNFFTTLLSSFVLPFFGTIIDEMVLIKKTMISFNFIVIVLNLLLFYLGKIYTIVNWNGMSSLMLVLNALLYIFSMFFLRFSVMSNNALLVNFKKKRMNQLSLTANFAGFSTVLVALLFMNYFPKKYFIPQGFWGLTESYWWMLLANIFSFCLTFFTFFAPSDNKNISPRVKKMGKIKFLGKTIKKSVLNLLSSIGSMCKKEYRKSWLFLFAYLFYSTSGTIFCIYVSQVFISVFKLDLGSVVQLNIFYTVFMVCGVLTGMIIENYNTKKSIFFDLVILLIQNFLFIVLFCVLYLFISLGIPYVYNMMIAIYIGLLYSWNASVSRGLFSKLLPKEKKGEFMAYYSSFTYLGISIVSGINLIANSLGSSQKNIFLLLIGWSIPSFLFFFWIFVILIKEKKEENEKKASIDEIGVDELEKDIENLEKDIENLLNS